MTDNHKQHVHQKGIGMEVKATDFEIFDTHSIRESNMQEILHEELNKLRLEHRKVKKQLIHAQTELDGVNQENENLQSEIDSVRRENTTLKQQLQNQENKEKSDALKLQSENEELKEQLKISAAQVTKLQELNKVLEDKLRESEENANFVKGLVREREYELSYSHNQKNDMLYNLNQSKIAMETQWKETLQQVTKKQTMIEEENATLKQQIATLIEKEKSIKNSTKHVLDKVKKNIALKNEKLSQTRRLLRREIESKEKIVVQLQMLTEEKGRLTESANTLRGTLEKLKNEKAGLKREKQMVDMLLRKREEDLAEKEEEIVALVFEHTQEKHKISSDLRRQLEDETFAVNTLKSTLRECKDDLRQAQDQILAHQQVFAALDVKLDSINST